MRRPLAVEPEDTFETLQRLRAARAATLPPRTSSPDGSFMHAGSPRDDGHGASARRHSSRLQTPPRDRSRERSSAVPHHMKTTVSKLHKTVGNVHEPLLERALGTAHRIDERRRERRVLQEQIRAHSSPRRSAGSEYGKLSSAAAQGNLKRISPMKQPSQTRLKVAPTVTERSYAASIKEKAELHRSGGKLDAWPSASSGSEQLSESLRTVGHLAASLSNSSGLDWL
jgi:hypothetical protein